MIAEPFQLKLLFFLVFLVLSHCTESTVGQQDKWTGFSGPEKFKKTDYGRAGRLNGLFIVGQWTGYYMPQE